MTPNRFSTCRRPRQRAVVELGAALPTNPAESLQKLSLNRNRIGNRSTDELGSELLANLSPPICRRKNCRAATELVAEPSLNLSPNGRRTRRRIAAEFPAERLPNSSANRRRNCRRTFAQIRLTAAELVPDQRLNCFLTAIGIVAEPPPNLSASCHPNRCRTCPRAVAESPPSCPTCRRSLAELVDEPPPSFSPNCCRVAAEMPPNCYRKCRRTAANIVTEPPTKLSPNCRTAAELVAEPPLHLPPNHCRTCRRIVAEQVAESFPKTTLLDISY